MFDVILGIVIGFGFFSLLSLLYQAGKIAGKKEAIANKSLIEHITGRKPEQQ